MFEFIFPDRALVAVHRVALFLFTASIVVMLLCAVACVGLALLAVLGWVAVPLTLTPFPTMGVAWLVWISAFTVFAVCEVTAQSRGVTL
jgi:hypothetical protein